MKAGFPKDFAYQSDFEETVRLLWEMCKQRGENLELRLDEDYYLISPTAQLEPFLAHIMSAK